MPQSVTGTQQSGSHAVRKLPPEFDALFGRVGQLAASHRQVSSPKAQAEQWVSVLLQLARRTTDNAPPALKAAILPVYIFVARFYLELMQKWMAPEAPASERRTVLEGIIEQLKSESITADSGSHLRTLEAMAADENLGPLTGIRYLEQLASQLPEVDQPDPGGKTFEELATGETTWAARLVFRILPWADALRRFDELPILGAEITGEHDKLGRSRPAAAPADEWKRELASQLRAARGQESQVALAGRSGVSDRTISLIEQEQLTKPPRPGTLVRLALATGQDPVEWLGLVGAQLPPREIERLGQSVRQSRDSEDQGIGATLEGQERRIGALEEALTGHRRQLRRLQQKVKKLQEVGDKGL